MLDKKNNKLTIKQRDMMVKSTAAASNNLYYGITTPSPSHSLHLTDNLIRTTQALDHLLTLLTSALGVVALLEQVVQLCRAVHLLQKLALHFVF